MTAPLLILAAFVVFILLSLAVGALIHRYSPIRDEDEELFGGTFMQRERLP